MFFAKCFIEPRDILEIQQVQPGEITFAIKHCLACFNVTMKTPQVIKLRNFLSVWIQNETRASQKRAAPKGRAAFCEKIQGDEKI